MNACFTAAPPRAPTAGSACAATFWVTTNPKRAAIWETNLRRMGAPSLMSPRSATNLAASVTVLASMPRTAKYHSETRQGFAVAVELAHQAEGHFLGRQGLGTESFARPPICPKKSSGVWDTI